MKGKRLVCLSLALLSASLLMRTAGSCHAQGNAMAEDAYQEGLRLFYQHEYEKADCKFKTAYSLAVDGGRDSVLAFMAMKEMAKTSHTIGKTDACILFYEKAAVMARGLNMASDEFDMLDNLRNVHYSRLDMQNVLKVQQRMDSLAAVSNDPRLKINLYEKLAEEALAKQDMDLAENYLQEREKVLDLLPFKDRSAQQFLVYASLRDFYCMKQDFRKSRKYSRLYIIASTLFLNKDPLAYAGYGAEAMILACERDLRGALGALDTLRIGLIDNELSGAPIRMQYYEIEGMIYSSFEEWDKACSSFEKALAEVEGTVYASRPSYFRSSWRLGCALYKTGKTEKARECLGKYLEYCRDQFGERSIAYADALWGMADFEGRSGQAAKGREHFAKSVEISMDIVRQQLRYAPLRQREAFWLNVAPRMYLMASFALRTGEEEGPFVEKCYEACLFSKALLLESERSMAAAINTECSPEQRQVYYEMVGLQADLTRLMNDYEKNKWRIDLLHQRISEQDKRLTPICSKLGFTSFLGLGYHDVKQMLGQDEVLLDYSDFESEEKAHQHVAFVVDASGQHPRMVKAFTEEDVRDLLGGKPLEMLYQKSYAEKAREILWDPIEDKVRGKRTVYYVPSGLMHQIALEAIPMRDGTVLADHYRLIRLSSAREIANLKKAGTDDVERTAMLYGALEYDVDTVRMAEEASRHRADIHFLRDRERGGNNEMEVLPEARLEIDLIEKYLRQRHVTVTVHMGAEGTQESFLALSGRAPSILHIATHGFYFTPERASKTAYLKGYKDPMQLSGLLMSGSNLAWSGLPVPRGVLDGVMVANQIACMDLRGTDLLVLSACRSGDGMPTVDGLYGLQRAFKKAGVQTMILTLWEVKDFIAREFMVKFYQEYAGEQNRWDKRNAFEKARTHIRKIKGYEDPYYWAGFIMLD